MARDADNTGTAGETHRGLSDVSFLTLRVLLWLWRKYTHEYSGVTGHSVSDVHRVQKKVSLNRASNFSVICDCFKSFLKRTIRNSKKHKENTG